MNASLSIVPLVIAAQLTASCALSRDVELTTTCPPVESIKTKPFRNERGIDSAYDKLRYDDACEGVLIRSLSNTKKMADPRQMPPDERFVVADAALFVLLERRSIAIEAVVPDEVAKRMNSQGIYAYFDYVASPSGREKVISQARRMIKN